MKSDIVSIVMATYNGEKYIKAQLESLLNQTRVPDEVIIIDDCSLDGTVEIIKNFILINDLKTWNVYVNKYNVGYKKNFYNCIKKSLGDYIFLADQDDEWDKEKIEKMLEVVKKNNNVKTLSCSLTLIDEKSSEIKQLQNENYYNSNFLYLEHEPRDVEYFNLAYIAKHNISPGCTMVVTREIANIFLDIYDCKLPHDWFLNMLAATDNGCVFYNKSLVRYRRHNNNTIGANNTFIDGIKKKTREVRIEDYLYRYNSIKKIIKKMGISRNEELDSVLELSSTMIHFYQKPSIRKLLKLRKIPEYFELSKKNVQRWEWIVALGLDIPISKIVSKIC